MGNVGTASLPEAKNCPPDARLAFVVGDFCHQIERHRHRNTIKIQFGVADVRQTKWTLESEIFFVRLESLDRLAAELVIVLPPVGEASFCQLVLQAE